MYGVTIESPIESPMVSPTILNSSGSRVQDWPYQGYLYPPKTNYISKFPWPGMTVNPHSRLQNLPSTPNDAKHALDVLAHWLQPLWPSNLIQVERIFHIAQCCQIRQNNERRFCAPPYWWQYSPWCRRMSNRVQGIAGIRAPTNLSAMLVCSSVYDHIICQTVRFWRQTLPIAGNWDMEDETSHGISLPWTILVPASKNCWRKLCTTVNPPAK